MDFKEMSIDQLVEQRNALVAKIDEEGADLDQIESEVKAINAEIDQRKADEARKAELRAAVANGEGEVIKTIEVKENKMENIEVRNTPEYIEAYANYIKTGKDEECRALLSENAVSGTVPVPEFVYDIVKTAWGREGIMSRVRKSYLRGNLKVGFEISGSDATVHTEGSGGVSEENLVLGTVTLIPASIKKWVSVSDEALDLSGENFLRYIYDELAYRIAKAAADTLISKIIACTAGSAATCVGVPVYTATAAALDVVAQAMGKLSDDAANPVVIMNKATWAAFKAVQAQGNYGYDPFEGLPVLFNNSITALSAATSGVTWAIVGDLDQGALANFPNGDDITFKFDDMTLATSDMVKIIGREFVGIEPVAPNAFVKIVH